MPAEIADSDAESDLGSPKAPAYSPLEEITEPNYATLSDPLDHVDFSQYLSPTQRLSSMIEQQEVNVRQRSTGSTDRFLKEIDELDNDLVGNTTSTTGDSMGPSMNESTRKRPKRRFSDIENGTERAPVNEMQRGSGKRSKTYGGTRSQLSDSASPLFSEVTDIAGVSPAQTDARHRSISSKEHACANHGPGIKEPTGFSEKSFQGGNHSVSTTRSSMGGYQGYEMNFRGVGVGMDINANPFGSLSQISMASQNITSEAQPVQSEPEPEPDLSGGLQGSAGDNGSFQPDTLMQMATSPIQPSHDAGKASAKQRKAKNGVHAEETAAVEEFNAEHAQEIEDRDDGMKPDQVVSEATKPNETAIVAPAPKKRGRKPKNIQAPVQAVPADEREILEISDDNADMPPKERYQPRPSRSRASTVDFASQASDLEGGENDKKHKRKQSAGKSSLKGPSSELHLNDPGVIGAPVEVYNPRPSKSRSRRIVDDEPEEDAAPKAEATAEEHLPSEPVISEPEIPAKSGKRSSKKGKGRGRPAKALIEKPQQPAEEAEDMIVIDAEPIETNTKASSTPEPAQDDHQQADLDNGKTITISDEAEDQTPMNKHFTIDLPPAPKPTEETLPPKAEPKKRGRKPKKKVEVLPEPEHDPKPEPEPEPEPQTEAQAEAEPEPEIETENHPPPNPASSTSKPNPSSPSTTKARQPLTEKHTNTPTPTPHASTSKPTPKSTPFSTKTRIGLSRRTPIPPLLRNLNRTKPPPTLHQKKEKLTKKQKELEEKRRFENEVDGIENDNDGGGRWRERGDDGMLVEWDD